MTHWVGSQYIAAPWDSSTGWAAEAIVFYHGGIWQSTARNTNSEPVSGNTDWTLVAGTPYVDVTVDPVAMTTGPILVGNPNLVLVPAPGAGKALWLSRMDLKSSAGNAWTFADGVGGVIIGLGLNNEGNGFSVVNDKGTLMGNIGTGNAPIADSAGSILLSAVLGAGLSPATYVTVQAFDSQPSQLGVSGNYPLTMLLSTTITGVGSSVLFIRSYYDIIDTDFTHSTFFTISAVNQGTKTFTVSPTPVGTITAADTVTVVGSTGNNGTYTVASRTATTVVVTQAIPSATGDGWVKKA